MSNIATSINQSKKLIEFGLDVNTADMYWVTYENQTYLTSMDKEFDKRTDTYAWSLSRLLELMPDYIAVQSINNHIKVSETLKIKKYGGMYVFSYHFVNTDFVDDIVIRKSSPLDAACEMMYNLLENKLIK